MNRWFVWSGILVLGLSAGARAEPPFFTLDGQNGFWGSGGVPDDAFRKLGKVAKGGGELKCVAFTMDGEWVFLFGGNGFHSSNTKLPVCKKLIELQKDPHDIRCVAFAPGGGWTILWDANGNWTEGDVPDAAFKKIQQVVKKRGALRSVAYGPKGAWVLSYNKNEVAFGNVPKDLANVLNNARKNHLAVLCVAFTGDDWICLTDNGWWTSNVDLPSAKAIARAVHDNHSPKWVAVVPTFGKHNFEKFSERIHQMFDDKTAAGYVFVVWDHGKVVASGSHGWARAPWEKENPSVKWSPDTPMQIASVSKTVTAVALLKVWEDSQNTDHAFSLDDPFWPHIRKLHPKAGEDVKRVTIRQLLMHTSGFKEKAGEEMPRDLDKLLNRPLAHEPGKVANYQNINYYLARLVLEGAGKVEYTPYVKEHVLKPMGVTRMDTHFDATRLACGYAKSDKPDAAGDPWAVNFDATAGAGGWFATANEVGKFLEGVRTHKVLSEKTTKEMLKDNLGWDYADPGWTKGGLVTNGAGQVVACRASLFPDGVTAVIFVNARSPTEEDPLGLAWLRDRGK